MISASKSAHQVNIFDQLILVSCCPLLGMTLLAILDPWPSSKVYARSNIHKPHMNSMADRLPWILARHHPACSRDLPVWVGQTLAQLILYRLFAPSQRSRTHRVAWTIPRGPTSRKTPPAQCGQHVRPALPRMPPRETIRAWHHLALQLCHGGPVPYGPGGVGNTAKAPHPSSKPRGFLESQLMPWRPSPCQISSLPISCHDRAIPWLTTTPLTTPTRHPPKLHPGGSKVSRSIANSWPRQPFAAPCHAHAGTPCDKPMAKSVTTGQWQVVAWGNVGAATRGFADARRVALATLGWRGEGGEVRGERRGRRSWERWRARSREAERADRRRRWRAREEKGRGEEGEEMARAWFAGGWRGGGGAMERGQQGLGLS